MNKKDFIKALSRNLHLSYKNADIVYNTFIDTMKMCLIEDGEVNLLGLIKLNKIYKPAKVRKNNLTGEIITIPEKNVIKAEISKTFLKKDLNKVGDSQDE